MISTPKVDIVKGEAERQRLQREELELELLSVKEQMHKVNSNDSDVKRSDRKFCSSLKKTATYNHH